MLRPGVLGVLVCLKGVWGGGVVITCSPNQKTEKLGLESNRTDYLQYVIIQKVCCIIHLVSLSLSLSVKVCFKQEMLRFSFTL